jgi:hypothetical protein
MQGRNSITTWMATVWLVLAAVTSYPCVAQRNNSFHSGQQRQVAQNQNHPQPHPPMQVHPQGHAGDWLRRYQGVPLGERERALQNDPGFRRLSPERQQMLRQRLQHFSNLPPQQQQRVLNRMETWEHLTPEQKQQARQVHGQLTQLPPDRRRMVTTAIRDLSAMPPGQRQQIIDSNRFRGMFSPQEREIMRGASRLPLVSPEEHPPEQ